MAKITVYTHYSSYEYEGQEYTTGMGPTGALIISEVVPNIAAPNAPDTGRMVALFHPDEWTRLEVS